MVIIDKLFLVGTALAEETDGLIPCGGEGQPLCGYDQFILLVGKVFGFITIDLAVPLAAAAIVYGGIVMVVSGSNDSRRTKAKDIIKYAVWGLTLALASWLIIKTIMKGLGVATPFLPRFFD